VVYMGVDSAASRSKMLAGLIVLIGATALTGRIVRHGFDPYDLQTAFLMILIFFGIFLRLNQAQTVWKIPGALAKFGASYSYSLYLVHNTVLVVVFEHSRGLPKGLAIAIGVVLAHAVALLVYHLFEKHHRAVGTYLRPIFTRTLLRPEAVPQPQAQPLPQPQTQEPRATPGVASAQP
jgi:peptidoglycan/LPS O-acetylase OafA/YrhL